MQSIPKPRLTYALETPGDHFDLLHTPSHGTVILWEKTGGPGRWHKLQPGDAYIPALLSAQTGKIDRYLTINEFYAWRLVRNIKSLRALYIDIDGNENLEAALEALRDAGLPPPTLVVFSGRGMHFYWLHKPVPAAALPVWQRCQDVLFKALAPLGGDPSAKDCTRVLRLVGSINSKSNTTVKGLILDPNLYEFRHLCNEILGYREPQERAKVRDMAAAKAERGQRIYTGSIYDRWHLVYRDLLTIAEWYFLGGIPEGHRDKWLFLCAVSMSWFAHPATLRNELERQAKAWTPRLTIAEIRSALQSPLERATLAAEGKVFEWQGQQYDPRYKFKRETLLEWMQPIIPPDLAPQLRAIISNETRDKHRLEIEQKRTPRDRVAEGRRQSHQPGRKVGSVKEDSTEQQKPWEVLNLSRRTYFRHKLAGTLPEQAT